jgi:hypothetical protein
MTKATSNRIGENTISQTVGDKQSEFVLCNGLRGGGDDGTGEVLVGARAKVSGSNSTSNAASLVRLVGKRCLSELLEVIRAQSC